MKLKVSFPLALIFSLILSGTPSTILALIDRHIPVNTFSEQSVTSISLDLTDTNEYQTLFSNLRLIGAFGAPMLEFGSRIGNSNTSIGGGGGVMFDNFFVGAYGMSTIHHDRFFDDDELQLGHGGFWLGYAPYDRRVVHPFFSGKLGWGYIYNGRIGFRNNDDHVFILHPEVGAEVNLTRFLRLTGSVGYRWVNNVDDVPEYSRSDFESLTGVISLRFMWLWRKR